MSPNESIPETGVNGDHTAIWLDLPVHEPIKELIERFYQLVDGEIPEVGKVFRELVTPDGESALSTMSVQRT
jgi:hypothetical protein